MQLCAYFSAICSFQHFEHIFSQCSNGHTESSKFLGVDHTVTRTKGNAELMLKCNTTPAYHLIDRQSIQEDAGLSFTDYWFHKSRFKFEQFVLESTSYKAEILFPYNFIILDFAEKLRVGSRIKKSRK